MKQTLYYILFILALGCVPIQSTTTSPNQAPVSRLKMEDKVYSANIKTVQLYPLSENVSSQMLPAIINLHSNETLFLEFDELTENANTYHAKIYNCTALWEKSSLAPLEYLQEYNEFNITNYTYSLDTDFPYVHYEFELPGVSVPGNYVLVVYRNGNENDLLLSRRFMVYQNQVEVTTTQALTNMVNLSRKNQQLEFFVRYENYAMQNPREVKVQLRQNARWDNIILLPQPTFVREDIRELEYRFFNDSGLFKGGNEFRFFDFRSIRYSGYRIQQIVRENDQFYVTVATDKTRKGLAYAQYVDKNGRYYIANQDYSDPKSSSNYAQVRFVLSAENVPNNSEIYLFGQLTDYQLNNEHRLTYNPASKHYQLDKLLKQGHYDYQYYVKNDTLNYNYLEGDHFETENDYEILVYHRPFGGKTDLLIGYRAL